MATVSPDLKIKMTLDASGLNKGAKSVRSTLVGMAKEAGTAKKHVDGLKASLGGIWRITGGILLFNVIRHITHAVRDLIGTVLDFETQMYNVNSVAQMGTEDFAKFQDQVISLALDPRIKDGPATLAAGLYEIVSAGYSAEDALVLVKTAAIAATAGLTTTDVAADVLISTLGAYGLGVEHATAVSDKLFQIVNISKYTFEDLASSLDSVTPSASALGVTIDDIGAAMATMAAKGVDADTATVQMNAILTALLKPTDAMTNALQQMGYESGAAMIEQEGFIRTLQIFANVLGDDEAAAAAMFGDVRALRGLLNLTNDGAVALTKNYELMGGATEGAGATAKALEQQMKANSFQIAVLRKNIQILAVLGFGLIAPYLNKALTTVNKFVSSSIENFRHFREKGYGHVEALRAGLKKTFMKMFGKEATRTFLKFFDAFMDFFDKLKSVISSVWGPFVSILGFAVKHFNIIGPAILGAVVGLKLFAAALAIVNIAMGLLALNPLTIAMIAVAAAAAFLAVAWFNNWGDIQGKTKTAVEFIRNLLMIVWDVIQPVVDAIQSLGRYWKAVFSGDIQPKNLKNIPGWLQPIAKITGRIVKSIRVFIVTWQKLGALAAFKTIPMQIRAFGRAIASVAVQLTGLKSVGTLIRNQFYLLADTIKNVIAFFDNVVHGRWKAAFNNLKNIAINGLKFIANGFKFWIAVIPELFGKIPWGKIFRKGLILLWNGATAIWTSVIKPGLAAIPGLAVSLIVAGLMLFYNVGRDIISWLWTGISSLWNWIKGQISNLPGALLQSLTWALGYFYNFGRDIVSWIWTGIASLWDWIMGQIAAFAEAIWNTIPPWLRKFVTGAIDVTVSAGSAVASGTSSVGGALNLESANSTVSAAGTSRTTTNNFTINGAQDPNTVAHAIMVAMKRAEEGAY